MVNRPLHKLVDLTSSPGRSPLRSRGSGRNLWCPFTTVSSAEVHYSEVNISVVLCVGRVFLIRYVPCVRRGARVSHVRGRRRGDGGWRTFRRRVTQRSCAGDPPTAGRGTPLSNHGGLRGSEVHSLGNQVGEEDTGGEALGQASGTRRSMSGRK